MLDPNQENFGSIFFLVTWLWKSFSNNSCVILSFLAKSPLTTLLAISSGLPFCSSYFLIPLNAWLTNRLPEWNVQPWFWSLHFCWVLSPRTDFWNKLSFFFVWLIFKWGKCWFSFSFVCFSSLRVMWQTFVSNLNLSNSACDAGSCPPCLAASPAAADSRREVRRTPSWRAETNSPCDYSIRSPAWMTVDRERMPTQSRWENTTHSQRRPTGSHTRHHSAARQQC